MAIETETTETTQVSVRVRRYGWADGWGRLSLGQLGALAGGLDYATVGAAVSRFARRLARDASLAKALRGIEDNLSNV